MSVPASTYRVRLDAFEGPLDLLLHLVKTNEVDIYRLPIAVITDQYLEYLGMFEELDLDIAGEYLVMAATLVQIKSRILLPPDPAAPGDEAAYDPRTELARQLVEYQRYKQPAENLHAIDSVRSLIWTRDGRIPDEFAGEELLAVELFDIVAAFKKLLHRLGDQEPRLNATLDQEKGVADGLLRSRKNRESTNGRTVGLAVRLLKVAYLGHYGDIAEDR